MSSEDLKEGVRSRRKLTVEDAIEIGKKYRTRSEFQAAEPTAYNRVRTAGRLDEVMPSKYRKLTVEDAIEIGKKYRTRGEFQAADSAAYNLVRIAGRLDEAVPSKRRKLTVEDAIEIGKKYRTRSEFYACDQSAYNRVRVAGRLDEVMPSKHRKLTVEDAIEIGKTYRTYTEWAQKDRVSYEKVRQAGRLMGIIRPADRTRPNVNFRELVKMVGDVWFSFPDANRPDVAREGETLFKNGLGFAAYPRKARGNWSAAQKRAFDIMQTHATPWGFAKCDFETYKTARLSQMLPLHFTVDQIQRHYERDDYPKIDHPYKHQPIPYERVVGFQYG